MDGGGGEDGGWVGAGGGGGWDMGVDVCMHARVYVCHDVFKVKQYRKEVFQILGNSYLCSKRLEIAKS